MSGPDRRVVLRSSSLWQLGWIGAATLVLRLPLLGQSLLGDEVGYLQLARDWARGGELYGEVFVDRPQLTFLYYRAMSWLPAPVIGLRATAIVCWALLAWFAYKIAELRRAGHGFAAAGTVVLLGSFGAFAPVSPTGELLAGTFAAAAMWAFVAAPAERGNGRLMLAGVLAGCAFLFKQSGIDAAVVGVLAVSVPVLRQRNLRCTRRALSFGAGVGGVALASVVHGLTLGWERYFDAMYGFRAKYQSILSFPIDTVVDRLQASVSYAAPVVVPVVVMILLSRVPGLGSNERRAAFDGASRADQHGTLLLGWLAVAAAAFLFGGQYWQSYWVALIVPAAVFAGGVMSLRPVGQGAAGAAVAALVVPIGLGLAEVRPLEGVTVDGFEYSNEAAAVGAFIHRRTTQSDRVQGLWRSVEVSGLADRRAAYRLLWTEQMLLVPDAMPALVRLIDGADAPRYVVAQPDFLAYWKGAEAAAAVCERYEVVASIGTSQVMRDTRRRPSVSSVEAWEAKDQGSRCPESWLAAIDRLRREAESA